MTRRILTTVLGITIVAGATLPGAAQQTEPPKNQKPSEITTLSGCVAPVPTARRSFTIEDSIQGQTYRLTGTDVRDYVGKHVEVRGSTKKLVIVGGLYPSPNVAAQAGDIDPAKAAIAAQSGPTSNMARPLVEFKVRSVRITPGECPKE